jgi:cellulose synthase/poly-beta-1,6-N-acetylglucosamine synthase-like glycosyltransferase
VPHDAKYIDSKKIAVILGVKAAQNDILVFTDADCEPTSKKWLENMVRSFSENTQIVLGYGAYNKNKSFTNMLQVFDTLFIGIQYLNYAIAGYPYMGVGRNMAYRKSFFEASKGFSKHLDIQSGDDDLFVNDFAKGKNTAVCVSPESITTSEEKKKFSAFLAQKERHLSTSGRYKFSSKLLLGTELGSRFLFYLGILLTIALELPYWYFIAPGAFILRYIIQYIIINLNAKELGERKFYLGIGLMDILLPLINLYLYIVAYFRPKAHYKWK